MSADEEPRRNLSNCELDGAGPSTVSGDPDRSRTADVPPARIHAGGTLSQVGADNALL